MGQLSLEAGANAAASLRSGAAWIGAAWIGAALGCAAILAYAGLLPFGRWQVDEYQLFQQFREWGWEVLPQRLVISPRPFSELLIHLYGTAVLRVGRPLVGSALAALWAGTWLLVAACAWSAAAAARSGTALRRAGTAVLLSSALVGFLLLTTDPSEAFFWPVAAAAYLPTLAAGSGCAVLAASDQGQGRRWAWAALLLVAASSSEMGAGFVLGFAAWAGMAALRRFPRRWSAVPGMLRAEAWWWCPALVAAAVVLTLALVRLSLPSAVILMDAGSRTGGHAGPALAAAARRLALELAAGDRYLLDGAAGFAAHWLFVLGLAGCLVLLRPPAGDGGRGQAPWRRWPHPAVMAGLATASLLSVFGAYYHYGVLCCARHDVVRQGFLALLVAMLLAACLRRLPPRARAWSIGLSPALLAAALAVAAAGRAPALKLAYAARDLAEQARTRTWQSGWEPGVPWMVFVRQPDGAGLPIHGLGVALGEYRLAPHEPDLLQAMHRFFGKTFIEVCDPWQKDRTWVIDGVIYPACGYGRDTAMTGTQEPPPGH